ncbi:ABC transporter permease [Streptomyces sp. NPDC003077]|uniref:ABC transporter permease n=1 Tax=Streptomyces sp. NPDC003077 TaxID=3154443 RepID=UPI0033BBC603
MLVLANLRERWSGLLAAFVAVTAGVALVAAALIVHDSSRPTTRPRLAAASVLVLPRQATDQNGALADRVPWSPAEAHRLAGELAAVPGVTRVVTDRSFYAQAFVRDEPLAAPGDTDDDATAEAGHGWSSAALAPYRLTAGRAPAASREVVVDRSLGLAVGQQVTINLAAGRTGFEVVGTVDGPGYYFTDAFARARHPGVGVLALLSGRNTSVEGLADRAGKIVGEGGTALSGDDRAAVQPAYAEHRRFLGTQLLTAMAALGLFTTGFVVASMLSLATGMRRREIGLLRMIGASPRQVRRMVLGEAAAIGVLASVAGCGAGAAVASALRNWLVRLDVAPPDLEIHISSWPLLVASAVGVGVSVVGAWAAARTAARVAPLEALRDGANTDRGMGRGRRSAGLGLSGRGSRIAGQSVPGRGRRSAGLGLWSLPGRGRLIVGLFLLGLGVVLAVTTALASSDARISAALVTAMALIAAAALLAPVLIAPVSRAVTAPFARSASAVPMLVRADVRAHAGRVASMAAPVIAAVGFAVLLTGAVETMRVAYPAADALKLHGQVIVTPKGTPGHSDEIVDATPPGRSALLSRAFVRRTDGTLTVVDALGSRDPRWDVPGEAVLGRTLAEHLGVRAGQDRPVRMADGRTVTVRIAKVLPDDPARGDFVMSRAQLRKHDPAALTDDIFIPADDRPSTALPGTAVHDATSYALQDYETDARLTDNLALVLVILAVGYSAIAVVNSMAMAAHARRRDFSVLASAGGTVRQLLSFAVSETSLVVAVGAGLGLLVSLPPLAGMAAGFSDATHTNVGLRLNGPVVAAACLGCLVLATGASALVTWWTTRRRSV